MSEPRRQTLRHRTKSQGGANANDDPGADRDGGGGLFAGPGRDADCRRVDGSGTHAGPRGRRWAARRDSGPDSITLLPISPTGAVVGVTYGFDMGHCGISSEIDVDGSFWDAVGVPQDSVDFDGWPGTFRLTSRNDATFTTTGGAALRLVRHAGAKEFRFCS